MFASSFYFLLLKLVRAIKRGAVTETLEAHQLSPPLRPLFARAHTNAHIDLYLFEFHPFEFSEE